MSKNILFVCHYASSPEYSNLGFRQFFICREWVKAGHDVTLIASGYNHFMYKCPNTEKIFNKEIIDGVKVIWVKNLFYKNTHGALRMLNWIIFSVLIIFYNSKKKMDAVICSTPSIVSFISSWILKHTHHSPKLILEVRDIWPLTLIELGGKSKYNPFIIVFRYIEKLSYKFSDSVVGTMEKLDVHIEKSINRKVNFKYIPQGIDFDFLKYSENYDIKSIQKIPPKSKIVIGFAGSITLSNNLITIIKASKEIEKLNPNINFYFLGDGSDKEKLIEICKSQRNVFFFDKVKKEYVLSFLKQCDILYASASPSKIYDYGISMNKFMDYMYAAKPILFSYNGYDDIISKIDNGFIVTPNSVEELVTAIMKIYSLDKMTLREKGERGRRFVIENRQFSSLSKDFMKLL